MEPIIYKRIWLRVLILASMIFGCMLPDAIEVHAGVRSQPPSASSTAATPEATQASNVPTNAAQSPTRDQNLTTDTTLTLDKQKFDLAKEEDLKAFVQKVKSLRALADEERDDKKESKKEGAKRASRNDWSDKKVRHGLKAMEHIAKAVQDSTIDKATGIHQIQEINWAVQSNFMTPHDAWKSLDMAELLFRARDLSLNASGRGSAADPASNLITYNAPDLSKVDPKSSTFWSRPSSIADKNLYYGFDRQAIPNLTDAICDYNKPHKGYGIHPSFQVIWHGTPWKVKFGQERFSGPFGSRIWWALGFPTEIYDYAPELKVRWDRRILSDFNSRQRKMLKYTFLGIPIETIPNTRYFDPFDYIQYAVLKDGSHVGADQLRQRLFTVAPGRRIPRHPEANPSLYNTTFENQIDYLVMKDASFTSEEHGDDQEIGFWDYNYLDHPRLREVRGMAVLDAWLDNWDIRWDNNRLELTEEKDGSYRLQHEVTDLGAAFGNSTGLVRKVNGRVKYGLYQNVPNDYEWAFTHPQAPGKTCVPIRDYMPIQKTRPFYELNLDDARWMARLIAQLTEKQIKEALIGSGFDAAEARLLLEKLVARRDQMIKDFGLSGEIPLLRPQGVDKRLSYDPNTDGPFEVTLAPSTNPLLREATAKTGDNGPVEATLTSEQKIAARNSGEYIVVNGMLKPTKVTKGVAKR